MIPKILLLVKEIRPRTPQVDNLRTPIPILLQPRAFETVKSIRDTLLPTTHTLISEARGGKGREESSYLSTAHDALILIVAKRALVANSYEGRGTHVAIADGAFAVAFVAETTDGDAGLLAAHY